VSSTYGAELVAGDQRGVAGRVVDGQLAAGTPSATGVVDEVAFDRSSQPATCP